MIPIPNGRSKTHFDGQVLSHILRGEGNICSLQWNNK
jgi:hypothetical protein